MCKLFFSVTKNHPEQQSSNNKKLQTNTTFLFIFGVPFTKPIFSTKKKFTFMF